MGEQQKEPMTMFSRFIPLLAVVFLAGCVAGMPQQRAQLGSDGRPVQSVYRINQADVPVIQARVRDSVTALRQAQGLSPVHLSVELTSAAATHARDMSIQGRPWHFGSDGSSPIDRVGRVGYRGQFLGEVLSETYENEMETLTAWMAEPQTREVILDPRLRELGFAWFQEPNGKLWWVMTTGAPF